MAKDVKWLAALPDGDRNGLAPIIPALASGRDGTHALVILVDCKDRTIDSDTGAVIPRVRMLRAEVILPADLTTGEKLMRRSLEHRLGMETLPLEVEDEITEAFGHVINTATGEVIGETGESTDDSNGNDDTRDQ